MMSLQPSPVLPLGLLPLSPEQAAEELLRRRQATRGTGSASGTFTAKYRNDPARFVRECIRFHKSPGPTVYQEEMLGRLPAEKRVSVRGPHGLGKTSLAAWVILWFALTREVEGTDWKIPTTASAWRQLTKYLWPEVRKWARRLNWEGMGLNIGPFNENTQLLTLSLKLDNGEAFALASNDASAIEGAHASSLLYIFDEARAIPDDIWDGAEGAFASPEASEALALAISTPGEPQGRFYDIHARKPGLSDWYARHVTLGEAIAAGRISQEWADQRKLQWGEDSAVYQNRVLGEFATSGDEGVIPLSWVERANQRWLEWADNGRKTEGEMTSVGVDVARSGEDKTVFALRYGDVITELRRFGRADTMQTTGRVAAALNLGGVAIVDVIGVGAGVVDRLREMGKRVVPFNASAGTGHRDRSGELGFADSRSAAWWNLREMLETEPLALPPDDRLIGDLTAPHWRVMSGGRIKVESKDEIRKRLGRSTDDGDAVIQAFWRDKRRLYIG